MVKDIYLGESQALKQRFADGKPFLVVPLDLAKAEHTAQCCTLDGRYQWSHPFRIWNNSRGVEYLLSRIEGLCRKLRIQPERTIYAGEDPSSYALAFIEEITRRGATFVRVRATKAAELRASSRASSDNKDLDGIAHAVLSRFAFDMEDVSGVYAQLRLCARARHRAVRMETGLKSRIHQVYDRLFPGFLDAKKSGILPFGPASSNLLNECVTPQKILGMNSGRLTVWLKKRGVINPEKTAETLLALAAITPRPDPALAKLLSHGLKTKVTLLVALRADLDAEENEMARALVQTPAALLTSIPGLGVALVGGIVGELGDPSRWRSLDQCFSYAGCAQRQKQSGGPDKPAVQLGLPLACNHRLKDWLLQAAYHVGTTQHPARRLAGLNGNHRLLDDWQTLAARDGHTRLGTAKRLLYTMDAMIREKRIYLPRWWMHPDQQPRPESGLDIAWIEAATDAMEEKWKDYDLTGIPDENNHLKIWRKNANEIIKDLAIPF
jgi:transposase